MTQTRRRTTPLLLTLTYHGPEDIKSHPQWFSSQVVHDMHLCRKGFCTTIGSGAWMYAERISEKQTSDSEQLEFRPVGRVTEWKIDGEKLVLELANAITHETFHHIFASWREYDVFSDFAPAPFGFGTEVDYAFDRRFNPFIAFLQVFSTDTEFTAELLWNDMSDVERRIFHEESSGESEWRFK
jgi:hypothetical protein